VILDGKIYLLFFFWREVMSTVFNKVQLQTPSHERVRERHPVIYQSKRKDHVQLKHYSTVPISLWFWS